MFTDKRKVKRVPNRGHYDAEKIYKILEYDLDIWAGVIPIAKKYDMPIPDPDLKKGMPMSKSTSNLTASKR